MAAIDISETLLRYIPEDYETPVSEQMEAGLLQVTREGMVATIVHNTPGGVPHRWIVFSRPMVNF
jgi:hypothetical protein